MNFISSTEKLLHRTLGNELDFDLKNYLIKGSFSSVLIQIFSLGLNFLTGIVLARILEAEGYGFFTYTFTLLSVLCTFVVFGMDDLLVRDVASYQSRGDFQGIKSLFRWSVLRVLFLSAVTCIVLLILINFTVIVPAEKKGAFNLLLSGIPVYSLLMIMQAGMRGLHNVIQSQLPEKILRSVLFLISIALVYFLLPSTTSVFTFISINITAYAFALLYLIFYLNKTFKKDGNARQMPRFLYSPEARSSFYFFTATMVAVVNVRADILLLGWLAGDSEVGIYNAAARFSDFTAFALLIITPVIAPSIARLFSLNEKKKLQHLASKTAKLIFVFAFLITIALVLFGKFALAIFGKEFIAGYFCMLFLCGGQLITTFAGPAGNILLMTGFEKLAFYAGLAGMIVNIALNILLIPVYGINGAAIATGCSLMVWNGMQTYFVYKKLGINSTILS